MSDNLQNLFSLLTMIYYYLYNTIFTMSYTKFLRSHEGVKKLKPSKKLGEWDWGTCTSSHSSNLRPHHRPRTQ